MKVFLKQSCDWITKAHSCSESSLLGVLGWVRCRAVAPSWHNLQLCTASLLQGDKDSLCSLITGSCLGCLQIKSSNNIFWEMYLCCLPFSVPLVLCSGDLSSFHTVVLEGKGACWLSYRMQSLSCWNHPVFTADEWPRGCSVQGELRLSCSAHLLAAFLHGQWHK